MSKQDEIRQLLGDLEAADNEADQRRIRRELRKRGYYISRQGKTAAAGTMARPEGLTSVVTTLRLEGDLHRRLQFLAADEGKSANAIIEGLLRQHLDEQGIPSRLKRDR
jgi:predicted HicB family RNase H-like nuclease